MTGGEGAFKDNPEDEDDFKNKRNMLRRCNTRGIVTYDVDKIIIKEKTSWGWSCAKLSLATS